MTMILVTGHLGYLGTHLISKLGIRANNIIGLDLKEFNPERPNGAISCQGSLLDLPFLTHIFESHKITFVIHLAATKELISDGDEDLFQNNVIGTSILVSLMKQFGAPPIVFASTAAVYAPNTSESKISESTSVGPISVYGSSKLKCEEIITTYAQESNTSATILRFFNIAGSKESKLFDHNGKNLPSIAIRALADNGQIHVFGSDLPTYDGTPVRDYVHVIDAISAIELALKFISAKTNRNSCKIFNIGSEAGTSVLDILKKIEFYSNKKFLISYEPQREGEVAMCVSSSNLAKVELGWEPAFSIDEIIISDVKNSGKFSI